MEHDAAEALRRSAREPEAFAHFYDAHANAILQFHVRRIFDAEVALDLTSETFAQAYLSRARFRGRTDPEAAAWLYRIAERQLSRYFRRGKAERKAMDRLGIERPPLDDEQQGRIEELADVPRLRATLQRELERLSRASRQAVELRVVEELPYPEVARRLDISEPAARARVSRALRAMATALGRNPYPEENQA
jgi:RNA polymerase sigma-70 factor (ECF subfamily)